MSMLPIPAKSLLTVTSGEYSDYSVRGVFRALREIDVENLRNQWLSDHPEQREAHSFKDLDFLGWVFGMGYLEPVECYEFHLTDYYNYEEIEVSKLGSYM